MQRLLLALLLLAPTSAFAEHMDVIEMQLHDDCSMDQFMAIVADFNAWGEENAYHARVAVPIQSDKLTSIFWMGTSKDAATFGKAWDTWRDALGDPESVPAQLWARFQACSQNLRRTGYDVY
ncbi:MAG: hypothetical protein GTN86_10980 [Xanthomonadales bacterium]|nr:hypothetical protein [Xanthomonadales bacterium]NIN60242.1 hypothetical protein [Xanthomonadales bacterium]NIN75600.1 hypothetical protein [Xanthomonadales bacterium]NIO14279.1 hypothetical protein [Xanthomonadales bacterium]NIP12635.1 hypothetical protein [Xanthomonadales bacterium]